VCPPDARQSAEKVSRNYSSQYEAVGESDSQDFDVPIPTGRLGRCGQGFTVTCSDIEAIKLIEDSAVMAGQVVDMLGVDMSLGYIVI
jgi:hypothetical protein